MKTLVVLLLITVLTHATPADPLKKYYVFKLTRMNWHAALSDCLTRNLHLATITSAAEQATVKNAIKVAGGDKENFWLSASDLPAEGSFIWMSTGQPVTYSNWLPHQPDNYKGNEHCGHIWNIQGFGKWNDSPCSSVMFHICEDKPVQKLEVIVEC